VNAVEKNLQLPHSEENVLNHEKQIKTFLSINNKNNDDFDGDDKNLKNKNSHVEVENTVFIFFFIFYFFYFFSYFFNKKNLVKLFYDNRIKIFK
jgi:hypothetical protein